MATYTLISSQVLGSSAASVTFSSIPQTYKDLVLRVSARTNDTITSDSLTINVNGLTTTIYSGTSIVGNGSAASSFNTVSYTYLEADFVSDNSATTNTFGSMEIYIPNYTAATNKPIQIIGAAETNSIAVKMAATAGLIRTTAAISSIAINLYGYNLLAGSSFYLYGI